MVEVITAWHYVPLRHFATLREGINMVGLIPRSRISVADIPTLPELVRKRYVYAFLESSPDSWKKSAEFPDVWKKVMLHVKHNLSSLGRCPFDVLPEDEAFVVDWAYMERVRPEIIKLGQGILAGGDRTRLLEANEKYINSATRLFNYQGGYVLPEVIVGNPIPRSRVGDLELCSSV